MKKRSIILILFITILLFGIMSVIALSEQKSVALCKKDCNINEKTSKEACNNNFNDCIKICSRKDKECVYECNLEKRNCLDETNFKFGNCAKNCNYIFKNITCGEHALGEVFTENCSLCRCEKNSRITCKKTDFCNYNKVLRNQTQCISNGGLYQPLCNGPYFDIVCSKDNFCLCKGENNYSCPSGYTCLQEFNPLLTRKGHTVSGWKTLLGVNLGEIGICVKKEANNPGILNKKECFDNNECGNGKKCFECHGMVPDNIIIKKYCYTDEEIAELQKNCNLM